MKSVYSKTFRYRSQHWGIQTQTQTQSQFHGVCSKANIQSEDPPDQILLFVSDHFTQKREEKFPLKSLFYYSLAA